MSKVVIAEPFEPSPNAVTKAVSRCAGARPYKKPVIEMGAETVSELDHRTESVFTAVPAASVTVGVSWTVLHCASPKYPG